MEKKKTVLCGLLLFGVFLWALPSTEAVTINVDCSTGGVLQTAIYGASAGDIISVTGTCNENVVIPPPKINITLDGGGNATIKGPDATTTTISVLGKMITIKGFIISGGYDGITVVWNASATIDTNTIKNTGQNGIIVAENSFVSIMNNMISNNPRWGIAVADGSSAYIGFPYPYVTVASPNTIEDNGSNGIQVFRSSSARIVGNTIRNNDGNGITVARVSHADISDNTIDGNGNNGIFVSQNSGINLGNDSGTTIFDLPNYTTVKNGYRGIWCEIGGYADGRRGTLNGINGVGGHDGSCINSTIP